jgi:hypothetical protein
MHSRAGRWSAPIERSMWLVTEWRDGKEIWWCAFSSEEEALEAASGSELPRATHPDPSDV